MNEFITKEMLDFFNDRTKKHIELVQNNSKKIINKLNLSDDEKKQFHHLFKKHDASKFEEPEKTPYVLVSWKYKVGKDAFNKLNIPQPIIDKMNDATEHHVKNNKHHPEYWDENATEDIINKTDRDKPSILIDGTKMPDIYIVEMICDWCAVSQERKSNPYDWADNNVNIRWEFTDKQKDFIYKLLNIIWGEDERKKFKTTLDKKRKISHRN